ncbi:MerR family transcriptional regulator [Nocardia sp. NPDC088792]|uniref:MerR family transcriptional regulator n=1 Tax=Nocardia sp. NPDC088792 TaxID=3364332 RepID=UPI00382D41EF
MKSSELTVGQVSAAFGLPSHVLRYWESEGLLRPRRRESRRCYGPEDVRRVALILLAREAGFGIRQVQTLLSTPDPMAQPELLRTHIIELDRRIAHAQATKELIEHAMQCPDAFDDCPHARDRITERIPAALRALP